MPDISFEGVVRVAKACHRQMQALAIPNELSLPLEPVTNSIRAAHALAAENTTLGKLIETADRALYAAKHRGLNSVCAAPSAMGDGAGEQT